MQIVLKIKVDAENQSMNKGIIKGWSIEWSNKISLLKKIDV